MAATSAGFPGGRASEAAAVLVSEDLRNHCTGLAHLPGLHVATASAWPNCWNRRSPSNRSWPRRRWERGPWGLQARWVSGAQALRPLRSGRDRLGDGFGYGLVLGRAQRRIFLHVDDLKRGRGRRGDVDDLRRRRRGDRFGGRGLCRAGRARESGRWSCRRRGGSQCFGHRHGIGPRVGGHQGSRSDGFLRNQRCRPIGADQGGGSGRRGFPLPDQLLHGGALRGPGLSASQRRYWAAADRRSP